MEADMPNPLARLASTYNLKIRRALFHYKNKITGATRPGSYPYVSGDSFRSIADHIHDETGTFDPQRVKAGDIVFVSNPMTLSYLQTIHPKIEYPYVLISHNGDLDIGKAVADLLDRKIVRLYAQDAVYEHEKIIPIPIGIENLHHYMNGVPSVLRRAAEKAKVHPQARKNKILFRFSIHTNPTVRKAAFDYFSQHPLAETFKEMLPPPLHLKKLAGYKFVASPPGNSIESCRTWEALELETVPIVKDFFAYRYFVSVGLPLWIVREWSELDAISEEALSRRYDTFMSNASFNALRMDFWIAKIRADQRTARGLKTETPHSP